MGAPASDLLIHIPDGTDTRCIGIGPHNFHHKHFQAPFEHYSYIPRYEACWSQRFQNVECRIAAPDVREGAAPLANSLALLLDQEGTDVLRVEGYHLRLPVPSPIDVSIGPASDIFNCLFYVKAHWHTLKICSVNVDCPDGAREVLEEIGNAWLFSLERATGDRLGLAHRSQPARYLTSLPRTDILATPDLAFNSSAMAIWTHARRCSEIPLVQFLAYYHVLEHFFVRCETLQARKAFQEVLESATFGSRCNRSLDALISVAKDRQFRDERAQLLATIVEITTGTGIRDHINADAARASYFRSSESARLAQEKVAFESDDDAAVLRSVSNRLYSIRCRIVHSKDDPNRPAPLLTTSAEVRHLGDDLTLIEMLAHRALVHFAKPIDWHAFSSKAPVPSS
jgi:hypothetical protein